MADDLKILLSASLNIGRSIKDINVAIAGIEKRIKKLKLSIEVPENFGTHIQSFIRAVEKMKAISNEQNKVVSESQDVYKRLDGTIETVTRKILKNGEIIEKVKRQHDENKKAMQDEAIAAQKLAEKFEDVNKAELDRVKISQNKAGQTTGFTVTNTDGIKQTQTRLESDGQTLVGRTITYDYKKARDENNKLKQGVIELRQELVKMAQVGVISKQQLSSVAKSINTSKDLEDLSTAKSEYVSLLSVQKELLMVESARYKSDKAQDEKKRKIKEVNDQLEHQLNLYKQQAQLNVQNANRKFDNLVDQNSLDDYLKKVNKLNTDTPHLSREMQNLTLGFRKIEADAKSAAGAIDIASKSSISFGKAFETAMIKYPIWLAASTAIFGTKAALESMLSVIIDVDTQMTELKKVMDQDTNFDSLLMSATESAREFGRTITGALESYNTFAKMGFGEQAVVQLGKAAMLLSTVGDIQDDESADYLTAAILQFNMSVDESSKIVDSWNETSNKYAVTSEALAQAIAKSGMAAKTANVDFNELNGMVTAIAASTKKSGNEIGNSLKTIFTRLRMDGVEEALSEIGISVYDMSGDFRSATDIFAQLSTQWSGLTNVQKSFIAEQISGKYHINTFMALINQYGMALDASKTSLESYGSATRELETFQNSLRFKINNLVTAFQDMSLAVGDAGLTDAFVFVITALKNLAAGFATLTRVTDGWNIKLPLYAAGIYGLVKAITVLRTAMTGLKLSFGWIGLGLVAVETLISLFAHSAKSVDVNTQAFIDNANEIKSNADNLQGLIDKHNELLPIANSSKEKQEELQSVLQKINDIAPHLIKHTDQYGNSLALNNEAAQKYIETLREMNKEQLTQAQLSNDIELNEAETELEELENKLSKFGDSTTKTFERLGELQSKFSAKTAEQGLENYRKIVKGIEDEQDRLAKSGKLNESLALNLKINDLRWEFQEFVDLIDKGTSSLEEYSKVVADRNSSQQAVKSLIEQKNAIEDLVAGRNTLSDNLQQSDGYIDEETGEWISNTNAKIDNAKVMNDLIEAAKNTTSEVESLQSAYKTLNDGEQLSLDTILELIEKHPELASALVNQNGILSLNKEAVEALAKAKEIEFKNDLEYKKTELTNAQNTLKAKLAVYSGEIEALEKLDKARYLSNVNSFQEGIFLEGKFNEYKALVDQINAIDVIKGADILGSVSAGSGKTNKPKAGPQLKDALERVDLTNELINSYREEYEAHQKNIKSLDRQIKAAEKTKDQAKVIELTTKKIEEQTKAVEALKAVQANFHTEANKVRDDIRKFGNENKLALNPDAWFDANNGPSLTYQKILDDLSAKTEKIRNNEKLSVNEKNIAIEKVEKQQDRLGELFNQLQKYRDAWKDASNTVVEMTDNIDDSKQSVVTLLRDISDNLSKINNEIIGKQTELRDHISGMADDIIDIYKDYYQTMKDTKIKAIELEIKALDKDIKKYEELYDAQLKLIDKEEANEEYIRKLNKLKDEQQDIQKELNVAILNDDISNKKRREELEKSLADKTEEINEYVHDREIDLRKENLNNSLDVLKRDAEAKKRNLEKSKEETEAYWNNLINDETRFAQIRQQVMSGVFTQVLADFANFKTDIGNNSALIGAQMTSNIINKISQMESQISTTTSLMGNLFATLGQTLENSFLSKLRQIIDELNKLNNAKTDALNAQLQGTIALLNQIASLSNAWGNMTPGGQANAHDTVAANMASFDQSWGTQSTYNSSAGIWTVKKNGQVIATGSGASIASQLQAWVQSQQVPIGPIGGGAPLPGMGSGSGSGGSPNTTPSTPPQKERYYVRAPNGNIVEVEKDSPLRNLWPSAHTGAEVEPGTSPISAALHESLNLNSNEKLMKLLKNEVVINPDNFKPQNFLSSILSNMKLPNLSGIMPKIAGVGGNSMSVCFNIENFNGTKAEYESFGDKIISVLNRRGL